MAHTATDITRRETSVALSSRVASAGLAIIFGILLVYGAGFAQPQVIHDAAHDSRHAFAFPCH